MVYAGGLLVALYVVMWLPFGEHTLLEHAARIFDTREAQDLRDGVKETGGGMEQRVREGMDAIARRTQR
jgi:hypothetical protein